MKYSQVGKIVNTRGLKGELKVLSDTDFKTERFAPGSDLQILFRDKYIGVKVKNHREFKGFELLEFSGLDDINLVEKYKGCELYAEDIPIVSDEPGTYRSIDLIGMAVMQAEKMVGVIESIRELPQGDYLSIRKTDRSLALIPFRDEFVPTVDLENKKIDIVDMEGLL